MFVDVSAKTKQNLDDLLETILLLSEVEELKANPDTEASGVVIESKLDPGRGAVVTILVQRGTLKVGDASSPAPTGAASARCTTSTATRSSRRCPASRSRSSASTRVPEAGEFVRVVENDRTARQLAGERRHRLKTESLARRGGKKVSLEDIFDRERGALVKELNLVLKADVSGSLEAFEDEIAKLPQDEVTGQVIYSGVGGITESDVNLAAASDAIVLGFNVRPVGDARQLADREGVEIRTYSVIYRAIDELRDAMQGMLAPEEVEETVGSLEVRADLPRLEDRHHRRLHASPTGTSPAAPSAAWSATARSSTTARSTRCAASTTTCARSQTGFECGIVLKDYADVKEGDVLEVYDDPAGRAHPLLVGERCLRRPAAGPSALPGVRLPEGASERAEPREGAAAPAPRRRRWPRSTTRTRGSARRWPWRSAGGSPGLCEGAADDVGRYLDAHFPQGARVERRLASWTDLESLG